jgi:hypothetical protein
VAVWVKAEQRYARPTAASCLLFDVPAEDYRQLKLVGKARGASYYIPGSRREPENPRASPVREVICLRVVGSR